MRNKAAPVFHSSNHVLVPCEFAGETTTADHGGRGRRRPLARGRLVQRGLHLLPDPLRHLLLREVRRVPRCAVQLVHRQPVPALVARARVPPAAPPARMIGTWTRYS